MTGDIVNLRRERRRRARLGEAKPVGGAAPGVGKRAVALAKARNDLADRRLAGHRMDVAADAGRETPDPDA